MEDGKGIIREYRIVNGRRELVRCIGMGGGVPIGGRGGGVITMARVMAESPRRDIGLKPRSEWTNGASKERKAKVVEPPKEFPKVVEVAKVELGAEIVAEVKVEERKACDDVGDALEYAAECVKCDGIDSSKPSEPLDSDEAIEEVTAEEAAALESKMEQPKVELAEAVDRNPPEAVEAAGVYAPAEVVIPEMPSELKPEERKALETLEAADGAAECFPPMDERGNGENPIAPEVAAEAVEVEVPRAAEVVVAAIEPQTEPPTMGVLPELPRPAGDGKKKKHRRRRRR